jgi:pyridoxal phosphate enzyme (YggS family)
MECGGAAVPDSLLETTLKRNVEAVEERIRAACRKVGQRRENITLVAVTKNAPDAVLPILPRLGILDLGENRPQELWRKAALTADQPTIRWHLIGHLQRNKIDRTVPLVRLIHSVDSLRLLEALDEAAAGQSARLPVLLEVNTSAEPTKMGFSPQEVPALAEQLRTLKALRVDGLMTMAAFEEDPEDCRPCFVRLRELRDLLCRDLAGRHPMARLSMGMSNDFEVAVEEGATHVRIGSALFEGLLPGPDA